jgi:hypothetical protein
VSGAPAWDDEWAYELANRAVRYLATNYPEGVDAADPYQAAVNEAAEEGDHGAYREALREYVRVGRRVALETRAGAA